MKLINLNYNNIVILDSTTQLLDNSYIYNIDYNNNLNFVDNISKNLSSEYKITKSSFTTSSYLNNYFSTDDAIFDIFLTYLRNDNYYKQVQNIDSTTYIYSDSLYIYKFDRFYENIDILYVPNKKYCFIIDFDGTNVYLIELNNINDISYTIYNIQNNTERFLLKKILYRNILYDYDGTTVNFYDNNENNLANINSIIPPYYYNGNIVLHDGTNLNFYDNSFNLLTTISFQKTFDDIFIKHDFIMIYTKNLNKCKSYYELYANYGKAERIYLLQQLFGNVELDCYGSATYDNQNIYNYYNKDILLNIGMLITNNNERYYLDRTWCLFSVSRIVPTVNKNIISLTIPAGKEIYYINDQESEANCYTTDNFISYKLNINYNYNTFANSDLYYLDFTNLDSTYVATYDKALIINDFSDRILILSYNNINSKIEKFYVYKNGLFSTKIFKKISNEILEYINFNINSIYEINIKNKQNISLYYQTDYIKISIIDYVYDSTALDNGITLQNVNINTKFNYDNTSLLNIYLIGDAMFDNKSTKITYMLDKNNSSINLTIYSKKTNLQKLNIIT